MFLLGFVIILFIQKSLPYEDVQPVSRSEQPKPDLAHLPNGFLDTKQLIDREGYTAEQYRVISQDGYVLMLTRIVSETSKKGIPVLLLHGATAASDSWLLRGKDQDLPFLLTDAGFDVWLGDLRGNYYSTQHLNITRVLRSDAKFWDFSFHEIGVYDVPKFIDKILSVTGRSKILFVGHSMGCTSYLIMNSMRPQYNDKIIGAALLAPAGHINGCPVPPNSLFRFGAAHYQDIVRGYDAAHIYDFMPRSANMMRLVRGMCTGLPQQEYCLDIQSNFAGEHRANLDRKKIGQQFSYVPAGNSVKTVKHLVQTFLYGFKHFDYGRVGNIRKYNLPTPPKYPLRRVTAPTALFYGDNDYLACPESVADLAREMPNSTILRRVPDPKFNHIDFILGINAKQIVYNDVIKYFLSFFKRKRENKKF